MKAILIIEDMPDKPGCIEINVMRCLTDPETKANIGKYDTLASKYMLIMEGELTALVRDTRNLSASMKQASATIKEPGKCLH